MLDPAPTVRLALLSCFPLTYAIARQGRTTAIAASAMMTRRQARDELYPALTEIERQIVARAYGHDGGCWPHRDEPDDDALIPTLVPPALSFFDTQSPFLPVVDDEGDEPAEDIA